MHFSINSEETLIGISLEIDRDTCHILQGNQLDIEENFLLNFPNKKGDSYQSIQLYAIDTYSRSHRLFAGAFLDGAVIMKRNIANAEYYAQPKENPDCHLPCGFWGCAQPMA